VRRSQASVCFTSLGNWFSLGAALNLLRACCSDGSGWMGVGREGMTTHLFFMVVPVAWLWYGVVN
jgi:hypothetical protein